MNNGYGQHIFDSVFARFAAFIGGRVFPIFIARRNMESSDQMHAVDALAIEGDEGRSNLR